jgi:hypothetical protein
VATADVFFPQVGTDKKGNAIAVWTLAGGVSGNRYIFATDWGQASQIGGINTNSEHVALAVDPEGSALAVWSQGTPLRVWASRFE